MTLMILLSLLLAAVSGTLVVASRDPKHQIFSLAANGLALSILFFVLQAPDVGLSELAVNTVVTPLLFLVTKPFLDAAASRLFDPLGQISTQTPRHPLSAESFTPIAVTLILLVFVLTRVRPTGPLARQVVRLELLPFRGLQAVHSGVIGDYIAWMVLGVAIMVVIITIG